MKNKMINFKLTIENDDPYVLTELEKNLELISSLHVILRSSNLQLKPSDSGLPRTETTSVRQNKSSNAKFVPMFTGQSLIMFSYMLPKQGRTIVHSIIADYLHDADMLRKTGNHKLANWQIVLAWFFALLNILLMVAYLIPRPFRTWIGFK